MNTLITIGCVLMLSPVMERRERLTAGHWIIAAIGASLGMWGVIWKAVDALVAALT